MLAYSREYRSQSQPPPSSEKAACKPEQMRWPAEASCVRTCPVEPKFRVDVRTDQLNPALSGNFMDIKTWSTPTFPHCAHCGQSMYAVRANPSALLS